MNSGHSRKASRILIVSLLLVAAVVLSQAVAAYFVTPTAVMHLGSGRFEVQIADTERARKKGLSDTPDLPAGQAMVFIFDYNSKWSIWMKDMNYPIDIVWLNESKQVVDFVINVPPDSYPEKTFVPKEDARYVVEFRSGTVQEKGIRVGQTAIFSGTSKPL